MNIATHPRQSLRLRGRSFLALVLAPEPPLPGWFRELDALIQGSPGFFVARPIILDVGNAKVDADGLAELIEELRARQVNVMGLEGVRPNLLLPGMPPIVSGGRQAAAVDVPDARDAPVAAAVVAPVPAPAVPGLAAPAAPPEPEVLLIDSPVRSGQTVVFQGDVTVVGSVASGAEIVAGGSIHIYGALRGRAIAGWNGNTKARIFCRKMEAELIAIDGLYQTAEDMAPDMRGRAVQAWLDGDAIKLAELG